MEVNSIVGPPKKESCFGARIELLKQANEGAVAEASEVSKSTFVN